MQYASPLVPCNFTTSLCVAAVGDQMTEEGQRLQNSVLANEKLTKREDLPSQLENKKHPKMNVSSTLLIEFEFFC